jgi:Flp pilus assembly pilin Flp
MRAGLFRRIAVEDGGQELIEYALVAALIVLAGWLTFQNLGSALASSYSGWANAVDSDILTEMPAPSGG